MTEWRDVRLTELGRFSSGKAIKPGLEGPFQAFGSNGVIGGAVDSRHPHGVIIGRVGAYCGSVAVSREPFWASDNTIVVEPIEANDLDYLYYLLLSANLNQHAGGAAQPLVTQATLKNLSFRMPGRPGRSKIAAVLRGLDLSIENNHRRVEVLGEIARLIYREWFVRLRYPGSQAAVFVDSILGPMPQDWEICRLEEAYSFKDGKTLKKEDRQGGQTPVYGANGIIGFTDREPLEQPCTVMGKIGSCGSLHRSPAPCWVTNNAFRVLPGRWSSPYSVWLGLHELDLQPLVGGAANPYLPLKNFAHLPVFLPPHSLQSRFDSFVSPLFEAIDVLTAASDRLGNLRDLLLPKLVSGRIDVSNLDLDALTEGAVA